MYWDGTFKIEQGRTVILKVCSSVPQVGEVKPGFGGGAAELLREEYYPEFMGISGKGGFAAAYPVELDVEGIRIRLEREYQD